MRTPDLGLELSKYNHKQTKEDAQKYREIIRQTRVRLGLAESDVEQARQARYEAL